MIFRFFFLIFLTSSAWAMDFQVSATQAVMDFKSSAQISGRGSKYVGAIKFSGDVGSIVMGGSLLTSIIQERIPWPGQGYTLYQGMAFDSTHWQIFWIYCNEKNVMTDIFYEGVGGVRLASEAASGSCSSVVGDNQVALSLPALNLKSVIPLNGFAISGAQISLASGRAGSILALGSNFKFLPFSLVDCTGCGSGGWYELHSLLWSDSSPGRACFVIVYLSSSSSVHLDHSLCLPDLSSALTDVNLAATWSKSGASSALGDNEVLNYRPTPVPEFLRRHE